MVGTSIACHALHQICHRPVPDTRRQGGLERHGLNVSRLIPVSVVRLALTRRTETPGEPVYDEAWFCQPHSMVHG